MSLIEWKVGFYRRKRRVSAGCVIQWTSTKLMHPLCQVAPRQESIRPSPIRVP
jgi:hypothetical protein